MASVFKGSNKAAVGECYCSKLFHIEQQLAALTPEQRYSKRLEQEKPVLDALLAWANFLQWCTAPFRIKAERIEKEEFELILGYLCWKTDHICLLCQLELRALNFQDSPLAQIVSIKQLCSGFLVLAVIVLLK